MEVTEPVISDNVDTLIEGETNKTNDAEPNNLVITNIVELKDPLELSLEIEATYGLKPCFVELERCDKIWETIQLIRDLQEDPNSEISDDENGSDVDADDYDNYDNDTVNNDDAETIVGEEDNNSNAIYDDEPSSSHNDTESCSSTQNNPIAPYIKYQPVLDNGNTALPNFQFSVHRTRVLYPCVTCGKQYSHIRSLREHEERIHHIIQPPVRKRSDHNNKNNDTNLLNNQENQVANKNKLIEFINSDKNTSNDDMLIVNSTEFIKSVLATEPGKKSSCWYCDKSYADKYSLKKHLVAVHGGDPGIVRTYKRKEPPQSLPEPTAAPVAVKCEEEIPQKKRRVERSRNLNVYRCETCGKHFYSQRNMRQHGRKVHGVYVRPPRKIVDSRKHIGNNNNNNNSNNNNNKKENEKTKVQTTLSISSNSLTYESPTKNKNSLKRKNATVRTCPICQVKLKDLGGFRTHCKKHGITLKFESLYPREQDKDDLDCKVCNKTFMTFNHILEHYWNIHQRNLRYKCYICGALSNNSEDLVTHLIKSHKIYLLLRKVNYAFKCHVCKNSFTNKDVYRMHMTQGHGLDVKTKQIERVLKSRARILSNPPRQTPTTRSLKKPSQIKRRIINEKARPSSSRSGLREKTKFNYDETVLLLDTALSSGGSSSDELSTGNKRARRSSNLSSEKMNTSVNNDGPTELNPTEPTFCILCSKNGYKNIRKHFIEYHKVRSPDKLIEQCIELTPASSKPAAVKNEKEIKSEVKEEKKEIVTPVRNSGNNNRRSAGVKKRIFLPKSRQSIPGPIRTFVGIQGKNGIVKYICKYCPLTSNDYEAMRRNERSHRLKDKIDSLTKPTNPGFLNLNPNLILKPRKLIRSDHVFKSDDQTVEVNRKSSTGITQSSNNNKAPVRRASFPLEQYQQHNRLTRGIVKLQEQIEHRCPICSRVFRNSDILASHKISCNVRVDNHQAIINDTSDTRESSDRDSGISITIKKKNDSYEIVSRNNSDDIKSQDSENRQNDLLLSDIPTDNYLNQNNDDKSDKANNDNPNNIVGSKNVPEYSETHETIKIQKDDDNDEEIVIDADDQNINVPVIINKPQVSKKKSTIKRKPSKVPSLVVLCTRELDKKYVSDCSIRKCYICGTDWPSPLSRGSHMTSFHKSARR
ncbi:uncharacterized protein LOC130675831 [Microplitis mediator]|uniref:uncharacterized protein LOC130675831 n=1 Tax=Microplitis mediator TaxID=375433 RepID=UPI002555190D|nr:uncharacterized protein LOC130675831 [Microplitis mediator]